MGRLLSATNENELTLFDNISDSGIVLKYRNPTTAERQGFNNMSVQRKGRKVKFRHTEARLKYGAKILTGFREGDFQIEKAGEIVPLSADQGSEHYVPEWKKLILAMAPDIIELLAVRVFEASCEIEEAADDEIPENEQDDDRGEDVDQD